MENGKAVGSSGVMSDMVNAAGEAWVDMITTLGNMIIVKGVIPAECCELSKGKGNSSESRN